MDLNTKTLAAAIGGALAGGTFAGHIKVDGELFALIVSPKASGEKAGAWNDSRKSVAGAEHYSDGMKNTVAMAEAGSELAVWALGLSIDGHSDWYIPSRDELELMYRNLKPSTEENIASFRDGDNPSSLPAGFPYTAAEPRQTAAATFQVSGPDALEPAWHWSSTQYAPNPFFAWDQLFSNGYQDGILNTAEGRARAVRRFKI